MIVGAGIVFTKNDHILCGYNVKEECWSGFGGTPEACETIATTAVRETVEELFGISLDKEDNISLQQDLVLGHHIHNMNYYFYTLDICKIFTIAEFLERNDYVSPYYATYPKDILELLCSRKYDAQEITQLEFVSKNLVVSKSGYFHKYFKEDVLILSSYNYIDLDYIR